MHELSAYKSAPPSERVMLSPLARRKDGALVMLGEFADRLVTKKRHLQIELIVYEHIASELLPTSKDYFLKRRAAWVMGRLFDTTHCLLAKEGAIADGPKFVESFGLLVRCCNDKEIPVKLESIKSIAAFFDIPFEPLKAFIADHILEIVDVIIATIEVSETADVAVNTLEALVLNFETKMAPFATKLVSFLVKSFLKFCSAPSDEDDDALAAGEGSPFSIASEVQEDENSAITLMSICRTINSFLEILATDDVKTRFDEVVPLCFPFLDSLLRPQALDYLDDALQTLAYLTFHASTFHPMFWKYYERMYQAVCGGDTQHLKLPASHSDGYAMDEVKEMLASLDNYCQQGRDGFVNGRCEALGLSYKSMFMKMAEKSMFGKFDADGPAYGFQMLFMMVDAFAEDITGIQDLIPDLIDMILRYLKAPEQPLARSMRENTTKIFCTILYAAPTLLFNCAQAKPGYLDIIVPSCVNVKDLKRYKNIVTPTQHTHNPQHTPQHTHSTAHTII